MAAFCAPRSPAVRGAISIAGAALLLALALVQLLARCPRAARRSPAWAAWAPPFGIVFAVDTLGALLVLTSAVVGLAVVCYARADIDEARVAGGFDGFVHVLLAGVVGAFVTGRRVQPLRLVRGDPDRDLRADDARRHGARQLDGAVKYVAISTWCPRSCC